MRGPDVDQSALGEGLGVMPTLLEYKNHCRYKCNGSGYFYYCSFGVISVVPSSLHVTFVYLLIASQVSRISHC